MMKKLSLDTTEVPFFRPAIGAEEIEEVVQCLRSGWLTSGPMVRRFEEEFAKAVGASYAIALNSCTAALHLGIESLGLQAGDAVLVPTFTFAATAEVVQYNQAIPLFVDCHPDTLNIDLKDAEEKLQQFQSHSKNNGHESKVVGIMPVHVGGMMVDMDAVNDFAKKHDLWVVEDAAHALPASYKNQTGSWRRCGEGTADVTCYSFYANKTITTGEGGMAVTEDESLAKRIRSLSLHGLSRDAWKRFGGGSWDYQILEPGYKYNMTDIAAAMGVHQLAKADEFRQGRQRVADAYRVAFSDRTEFELPVESENRIHSWHLFPIRLNLEHLTIDRNEFIECMRSNGVSCSVHWRPLHLHPYYEGQVFWKADDLPEATRAWPRIVSLPLFPAMTSAEVSKVIQVVQKICDDHRH